MNQPCFPSYCAKKAMRGSRGRTLVPRAAPEGGWCPLPPGPSDHLCAIVKWDAVMKFSSLRLPDLRHSDRASNSSWTLQACLARLELRAFPRLGSEILPLLQWPLGYLVSCGQLERGEFGQAWFFLVERHGQWQAKFLLF